MRTHSRALAAAVALALGAQLTTGCSHSPPDATPDGALRLFLDDLEVAEDDGQMMKRAYELLGPTARANLTERAHRVTELQGRQVQAWEMLASGRLGLAFRPKTMRSSIVGDRATVEVIGAEPATEHASVVCVREGEAWRIEPGLPEP
jgi:hypothetical protein